MNIQDIKEYNEMIRKVEGIYKSNLLDKSNEKKESKKDQKEEDKTENFEELFQEELKKYKK